MIWFLLLPIAAQVYISWHVWNILPLPGWIKTVIVILLTLAFLSLFVNFIFRDDSMSLGVSTFFYEVGTSWLIILLYLFMLFLILDVGRLIRLVPASFTNGSMAGSFTVLFLMIAIFVYGNINYHNKVREEMNIKTPKPLQHPVKIVMMSDLHLGYHNRKAELARWVDMVNKEKPDLILIAGDIIDISVFPVIQQDMASELQRLEAPIYACLGNHEYYANQPKAISFYRDAGINLLVDASATVGDITIIGRDDRTNSGRKHLKSLTQAADMSKVTILLDHQPYHLEQAERLGIDLQLSGHTHHGQIWPISWITEHIYECAAGSWQRGNTHYFISSGIGIWGGKFRIGTHSDYLVATISN